MTETSHSQQLDQMITGYWTSQAIYAVAKFGIADLLKDGPRTVEQLAEASSTNTDALYRLLRALASIGIFSENSPKEFSLTPLTLSPSRWKTRLFNGRRDRFAQRNSGIGGNWCVLSLNIRYRLEDTGKGVTGAFRLGDSFYRRTNMTTTSAVADGSNEAERKAASDAVQVQDAVNLVAIVGAFHRHLLALHRAGTCGDDLINHPVSLAFTSKLNRLCRMTFEREMAALRAIDQIEQGEAVEYEVIPL